MALTPYTRQEEWYQQMINASTGNYLPPITAQDEGKVLTVENDGSWGVENVPNELPAVGSDDKGKFLHTNESTGALEWSSGGSGGGQLPTPTAQDVGKVATVVSGDQTIMESRKCNFGGSPTSHSSVAAQDWNADLWVDGTECTVTIGDATDTATITDGTLVASDGTYTYTFSPALLDGYLEIVSTLPVPGGLQATNTIGIVVNGDVSWGMATPSAGGGGIEIVKFADGVVPSCDHTFAELEAARTAGKEMFAYIDEVFEKADAYNQSVLAPLSYTDIGGGAYTAFVFREYIDNNADKTYLYATRARFRQQNGVDIWNQHLVELAPIT